jgi:glycosyltransferase involved in cell wall biosynthesis
LRRATDLAASIVEFPLTSVGSPSTPWHLLAFARWCRQTKIAVVHATDQCAGIFALPGAAFARVPLRIGSGSEINPDSTSALKAMRRAAHAAAHKIVATSRTAAERLRFEGISDDKIVVVPHGLEFEQFEARRHRTRVRKVIVVASLRPENGHDVLIDAAVNVLRRFPDAHFEILGDGPELEAVMARADARRLLHAFHFLGYRDDVRARLIDADLFVLPARSEPFPSGVLQAMAAGLPIVATAVGSAIELIDNGRTGLLVPPDDARRLANRLCCLMADPALAARLGEAARAMAQARYSFKRIASAFEFIYVTELTRRHLVAGAPAQAATY